MSRSVLLTMLGLLVCTSPVAAMPVAYHSCEMAEEKLIKAQIALKAAQQEQRVIQRQEQMVRAELEVCRPGGLVSLHRARRCAQARKNLPTIMTHTVEATHRVQDYQQEVRDRQAWQTKVCNATSP